MAMNAMNGTQNAQGQVPVLELQSVCKHFGGLHTTREVSLTIQPGERKALIGPNGAGKTTLFNLISGAIPVSSGRIMLFGKDVTSWPSHRRAALGLSRTFQVTHLFPRLTVLENLVLALLGRDRAKFLMWQSVASCTGVLERAQAMLNRAGFQDRATAEARKLSHGEQRQLEILLGLANEPKLLLLDEPAAGLSSGEAVEMTKFLARLDPGLAWLLIEHDMDIVFQLTTEIHVLHFGQVIERGAPEQIRSSARVQDIYFGTD